MSARTIEVTDEGFRDGPQSLWGSRMSTQTMVDIAERVDQTGYQKSLVVSGATFEAAVQHLHEQPWLRLDAVTRLMRSTPAAAQIRGRTLFGWQQYPDDVVDLFISVLARHGISWLLIYEALNDMRLIERHVKAARNEGLRVTIPVCYSVSPVHTPEYFADVFEAAAGLNADSVSLLDASGLLDASTAGSLSSVAVAALGGTSTQLEMNVHDLTGRALDCYQAGLNAGVEIFATTPGSISYGRGIPSVLDHLRQVDAAGLRSNLDRNALSDVESYFRWATLIQGETPATSIRLNEDEIEEFTGHQIPGGMMSNLIKQLTELGIADKVPKILEEVRLVRSELGYPTMVTPCSQLIGVQATLNVLSGQRYENSPVEIKNYVRGIYGTPPGPIDPNVVDRVLGDEPLTDAYERLREPMLPEFVAKNGPFHSDEDLLLAVMYSQNALEQLRARDQVEMPQPRSPQASFVSALLERVQPTRLRARL